MSETTQQPVLEVKDLSITFASSTGTINAVSNVSFHLHAGETLGIVGESGSGKSQTVLALMGLLAHNGTATGSAILRIGTKAYQLVGMDIHALNQLRGSSMSMIFQDPMTSLNPYLKIRTQMTEVLTLHQGMDKARAERHALNMLERVRIPEAKTRLNQYPHELSGGMRQRVMIAMALLCEPALLIADEPTTALDVTIQAQVLYLLQDLKRDFSTAIVFITHDLGVVAGVCDRVQVMYGGRIAEIAPVESIFYQAQHPYTRGLLQATPVIGKHGSKNKRNLLATIEGQPPNLQHLPRGCAFAPRCEHTQPMCTLEPPPLERIAAQHQRACYAALFDHATLTGKA